ncbi:MAG: FAD-binding protein [Amaricoccus sp.]
MPKNYSRKDSRDAALIAGWRARPEREFTDLGLRREALEAAQLAMIGRIILPGDADYDQERLLSNPAFNPFPALIVMCEVEGDVAIGLAIGERAPMSFTVRSGGHCTAGFSSGYGVLIDVSGLDSIHIDVASMQAVVGAGCNFGALNKALDSYGVHLPAGECDDVCVGGFVQGGGLGFTSTTFGMNCDNVIELRVMLADGSIVIANEGANRDLWWAMRGGTGGNFGILLSVTYRIRPLGDVTGLAVAWRLDTPNGAAQATDVLLLLQQSYMRGSAYAPSLNLQALWVYQSIVDPSLPPLPQPVPVLLVRGLWVGDPAGGTAAFQPLLAMPGAVPQFTLTDRYPVVLDALLGKPQDQPIIPDGMGMPNEDKASRYVSRDLTPSEWRSLVDLYLSAAPTMLPYMYLELYGGAIASYPIADSAFIHRDAVFNAVLDVFWYPPKDRAAAEAFLNSWIRLLETFWNGEVYQNYASINVPDFADNYWASALAGLVYVKKKYDGTRLFTFAQAIPADAPSAELPAWLTQALAQPIDRRGGAAPPSS